MLCSLQSTAVLQRRRCRLDLSTGSPRCQDAPPDAAVLNSRTARIHSHDRNQAQGIVACSRVSGGMRLRYASDKSSGSNAKRYRYR